MKTQIYTSAELDDVVVVEEEAHKNGQKFSEYLREMIHARAWEIRNRHEND